MADQHLNGLPYGHFGQATYNSEDQSWCFERQPGLSRNFQPLGTPGIAIKPSRWSVAEHPSAELPSHRHEREIKQATRVHPEIQSATPLLRPLLQASEAVETATNRHDPIKGPLLSFGRVFDEQVRRSTQVVAFASGAAGSDVRVVQMQMQRQGWLDGREIWLEVPVIAGEETVWRSGGSPVLQICFAQPLESGENLLAVRTESRTMIFKPILRTSAPGRLQLKHLFELPAGQQSKSAPHADVAFNPWFPRQFAVIDRLEHLCLWEFRSRESSEAICVHSFATSESAFDKGSVLNDGWARLLWVCNPSTVAIATRRNVALYDLTSGPSKLQDLNIGVSDVLAWVLDVAHVPSDTSRVVILTSTHLHLVMFEEERGQVQAKEEMRIRHFQNPQDITLRSTLYRDEEDLTIILRSALNTTAIAYRLTVNSDKVAVLRDPVQFKCQPGIDGALGLHFQPIAIAENLSLRSGHSLLRRLRTDDCRFVSLMALKKDLSIFSLIYLDHPSQNRTSQITAPEWHGKPGGGSTKIKESFVTDEFVMPSDSENDVREPVANHVKQRRGHGRRLAGREWTIDHERMAHHAQRHATQTTSIDDVIDHIKDLLDRPMEPDLKPMTTAFELSKEEFTVNDMDRVAAQTQQLIAVQKESPERSLGDADGVEAGTRMVLRPIWEDSSPSWAPLQSVGKDLTLAYGRVVSQWISPLSDAVPGRIRLAKEQLARRLAAEVVLAAHVLRPDEPEGLTDTQPEMAPESQSQSWELPMRGAEPSQASQFSNAIASQSALPTPSPTGTPSVTTASSRTSAFTSAEVSRLSNYASFTKPAPSALPRSLNKVLDHWTVGADPAEYDWIAASRRITQRTEEEEAESQLTEKQRARMHRKAERHIRRQRKEAAASQQQHLASSQMPELVVSASQPQFAGGKVESQPAPGPGGNLFSGGTGSSQIRPGGAASQAMAGRFGGRPPAKKKRKQGF